MDEKTTLYEADVMALPPLRMVLGEVPTPDPDRRQTPRRKALADGREMTVTVRRLIAHLEKKQ